MNSVHKTLAGKKITENHFGGGKIGALLKILHLLVDKLKFSQHGKIICMNIFFSLSYLLDSYP